MAEVKYEDASVGDLLGHYFRMCPEPDAMGYDKLEVMECAKVLLELRRRAVDKRDVKLLNDVMSLRSDLRDVIHTINQNQSGQTKGILLPGMAGFNL